MSNPVQRIRRAISELGFNVPDELQGGQIVRFPGSGKTERNRAGWCYTFDDYSGAVVGDWSTGYRTVVRLDSPQWVSRAEQRRRQLAEGSKQQREKEQNAAARRAGAIWSIATEGDSTHPYMRRKRVKPHGAKSYRGLVVLPITTFYDELLSLQFIDQFGNKRLLSKGKKKGCFIRVCGDLTAPKTVVVCEGWATGATLAEEFSDSLILAAIDTSNLLPVAVEARSRWPGSKLIVAGDDDRLTNGNPGAIAARRAATAAKAKLMLPDWPDDAPEELTDFNDLANWLVGAV